MTDPIRDLVRELLDYAVMCGRILKSEGPWDEGDDYSDGLLDRARTILAAPTLEPDTDAVLGLAAIIREVGSINHRHGAAALAEAILAHPAAREVFAAPAPPADPDALAARPLLEAVAQMGDCVGRHTVGQIMALSNRAASWLNENPPGQPVAIEPRGCPTPGACSCVQPVTPTPPADGEAIGPEWRPCVKLPITVHVREQRPGETHVSTREGITPVNADDLIMRGVQGEEYPIGRELFNRTYRLGPAPASAENTTPPADGEGEIPGEVRAAFAELERCEENLRGFRQLRADLATTTPTPPADGKGEELAQWLDEQAKACATQFHDRITRAAALLRQLPPEGLVAMEYSHTDSGARVVHEPRDGEPGWCWTVRNHRHVNPFTEFSTLAAAWEALQQARRQEESDD